MSAYRANWTGYAARYDTAGGDQALVVEFPGGRELSGPAGTLIGLVDLVDKVLEAIDSGEEREIVGAYRWPPTGFFLSQTFRMKSDSRLAQFLDKDWNDAEQVWYASIHWAKRGDDYYVSGSMGLRAWRSLSIALANLMSNEGVQSLESVSAVPAG
jgi:hypothetical protein